ncbi:uncharacterized protein [Halyomorpha halys]|uniref:uncharacterized protein n=1 Tax=Halyomorpha halys TaxID=286706 RepID=UPI0034D323D6
MEKVLTMISQMNFKKIEDLLKAGADVNIKIGLNEDTLLHCSYTYDVTKLLLSYGVDVNARNLIGETPLHCAAIEQKGLGLVQELLKYGADVNAVDNEGKTALYHSVDYRRTSDDRVYIWKELLFYGADINMSCLEYEPYRHYCTSLCKAIENEDQICAKFLIKMFLIKNFKKGCRKVIDFSTYIRLSNTNQHILDELLCYQDDCVSEILQIKSHKFNSKCSLYDFLVIIKGDAIKPLYSSNNNITNEEVLSNYPIYNDVILSSLELCLQRGILLEKLKKFETGVDINLSESCKRNIILLTSDCMLIIAEYLTNDDLSNFIEALN